MTYWGELIGLLILVALWRIDERLKAILGHLKSTETVVQGPLTAREAERARIAEVQTNWPGYS